MSEEIARKKQERTLVIKRSLLNALVLWQKDGILTNFTGDEVQCGCFLPGHQENWIIRARLFWDSSDFNTQIRLRKAILDFAEQLYSETGLPVHLAKLDGPSGQMTIQLLFYSK